MGLGGAAEVGSQVLVLFLVAQLWFRHGLPAVLDDVQPLVADIAGANASVQHPPPNIDTVDYAAAASAVAHTALILVGLAVGHAALGLRPSLAFGTLAAVTIAAFCVLRFGLGAAGLEWTLSLLGLSSSGPLASAIAASQTAWLLAGLLLPLVDSRTVGIFPEATVRYLPTMTAVYLGAFAFFHSMLQPLWNGWLRHATRGILGLEGSFPVVEDPGLVASHGLFLSTTHVLSLSAGIAGCYYARVLLYHVDRFLDPVPSGTTVGSRWSAGHLALSAAVIAGLAWLWTRGIGSMVGLALQFNSGRAQRLSHAFLGGSDPVIVRRAAMVSYGLWFVLGGLFELAWPVSASNRPRPRPSGWRLRREDAGGINAESVGAAPASSAAPRGNANLKGGPPPGAERGVISAVLPSGGLLALTAATFGYTVPVPAALLLAFLAAYHWTFYPEHIKSADTYDHTSERYRRIRKANFPPPYPNSWYRICNSADLEGSQIKSISALGREFVAFRGADGRAGVLNAFCPHLGAHLGAGCVRGNSIQCPYHNWEFNADGQCTHIPYSRYNPPKGEALQQRTRQTAYEVREHLGMVFIWFDAEGRPPQWEPKYHLDVMDTDTFYFTTMGQMKFDMHVSEAHENSADWYHFQTLHRPFPIPGLSRLIAGRHDIRRKYGEGELTGNGTGKGPDRDIPKQSGEEKHIVVFDEQMDTLYFLGVRIPYISGRTGGAHVIFEGPAMMHFTIDLPMGMGRTRMIKTFLPISPFQLQVEVRWFAEKRVCPHVVHFMKHIAACALGQDREVWDRKLYRPVHTGHSHSQGTRPMTLADNDGPFRQYREWYAQFYSEHSADMDDPEKLTW